MLCMSVSPTFFADRGIPRPEYRILNKVFQNDEAERWCWMMIRRGIYGRFYATIGIRIGVGL